MNTNEIIINAITNALRALGALGITFVIDWAGLHPLSASGSYVCIMTALIGLCPAVLWAIGLHALCHGFAWAIWRAERRPPVAAL